MCANLRSSEPFAAGTQWRGASGHARFALGVVHASRWRGTSREAVARAA
jgi:hypothetical protein